MSEGLPGGHEIASFSDDSGEMSVSSRPSARNLLPEGPELPVLGIAADSRKVQPGFLFVAIPGTKADGLSFVADAAARGAVAIIGEAERPDDLPASVAYARVPDARRSLALAAAKFYPAQPETVVAVTGTSGKSSVADFTRQLFAAL